MTRTVLVVDDNPTNLKLARFVLEDADFEVLTAENAEEARGVLASQIVQVVLMDLQMPGTSGLELTRELRADPRFQTLPILALTAAAMKGDKERALEAGCNAYITKPFDTRTLPEVVGSFVKT